MRPYLDPYRLFAVLWVVSLWVLVLQHLGVIP
jgi:hypothetical protein